MRKSLLTCLAVAGMLLMGTMQSYALEKDGQSVYQIATVDDLLDFADLVNEGTDVAANAVLTTDIDLLNEEYYPIGNVAHPYQGTFDGQGHRVENMNIDSDVIGVSEYLGFFGCVTGGAHIKNIIIGGGEDAFVGGTRFCGGVVGGTNGHGNVTIENCGNEAWIYTTEENAAGILGVDMLSQADVTILNCYNTGDIQGARECATICGWIGDRGVCKNCWNTGTILSGADTGRPFCRYNGCEFENNWDIQGAQTDAGIGVIKESDLAGMATGEFCYRVLNQTLTEDVAWFQKLGVDAMPVPFADHGTVYAVGDLNCDGTSKSGETTYSNTNTSNRDPHNFHDGACTVCDEFDPTYMTADDKGFFTLASDADLYWFIRLSNMKDNNKYSARLAADINYTHDARLGDAETFMGTFDGQDHTVTFAFNSDADKLAFIKNMRDAVVENVTLKGSIVSTTHFSAGVVSEAYGTSSIKNVVADVDITSSYEGDGTHGGLVAVGHDDLTVENCAYVGTLTCHTAYGTGGIVGWSGDGQRMIIKNCYVGGILDMMTGQNNIVIGRNNPYIEDCWVSDQNEGLYDNNAFTTFFYVETISTGEFCYKDLNGTQTSNVAWFQTLGTDAYPVPFASHGTVYVAGAQYCDGTPKGDAQGYSNDPAGNRDPHQHVNGFCSVCGAVDMAYKTAGADGYFELASDNDLHWFAAYVKTQETKNANAKLTADIEYTAQEMIGMNRCNYGGTFDGQGHVVEMNLNRGEESRAALFDWVENATIKNLVVGGEVKTDGQFGAGLVVEAFGATTIKNVVVMADINSDYEGDGTHGGVVAIGHDNLAIENVAFVGSINAELSEGTGGIIGYTHGGRNTTIKNSYVAGDLYLLEGSNNITIARNNPTIENCYASWDISYYENNDGVEFFDVDDEMASGELCYNLGNKAWFQTLGTDEYPVPFNTHATVYAHGTVDCSGHADLTYDNVEGEPTYENHNFVDGECTACHNAFQISTVDGMVDLAYDVMGGDKTTAYIELTTDLDLAGSDFFAIGGRNDEGGNPFRGHFNGKGHTVNLALDTDANNQGLIGVVADGAVVENVIVTGSVVAHGYAAGVVGATTGSGKVVIMNCGNEADVTVAEANAAGILGVDDGSAMEVTIRNCYNTGNIVGGRESAAICGWLGDRNCSVANSWNSGDVQGVDGSNTFFRNGNAKAVNCYETIGSQVTSVTDDQVANGELKTLLNNGAHAEIWYQTVGTDAHPMLNFEYLVNAIETIPAQVANGAAGIYTIGGAKVATMQKGINIVRMEDGSVRKVLVK
ncbi:MAG: hypothetical protein Q4D33_05700 [Prevotellaceae bacterium]|nr:hypothetical protein [Prevotellaceae bacterium]